MLSTQLIVPNYPVILSHQHKTTVSLESATYTQVFTVNMNSPKDKENRNLPVEKKQ